MNKIYLFLWLLLSALLTACYEDTGNYDYHPVNEIQISNIEKEYIRERWQHLLIEPQMKFSLDEKGKMAWRWEIDGKLVSEDLNLSYDVAQDVADDPYKCRFTAIYLADSTRFYQEFDLKVVTPYDKGLMVLSEQEGKAMLSFRPEQAEDKEFSKWVYQMENGSDLEGKPLSLEQSWPHDDNILIATSRANYKLDRKILKLLKRYDGSTMLDKDPDFEMKFCQFSDMVQGEDYGCAIGTNGRVYTFREYNDYFSTPSPMPVPDYYDASILYDYRLSDKCLIVTAGWGGNTRYFLGYDDLAGRFLYFYHSSASTIDDGQLNTVLAREPIIGLPILAIGGWKNNTFASFFYDPQTGVAKVVKAHDRTFSKMTEADVLTLSNHHFTPSTILKFSDKDGRAIFSSDHLIRQIYMEDVTAESSILSEKLPQGAEITCLKLSADQKLLYVGVLSDRTDEFKGDLYILDAVSGEMVGEPYLGVGGKVVDILEKY